MERAGFVGFALVLALFMVGLTNDIGRLTGEGFQVRVGSARWGTTTSAGEGAPLGRCEHDRRRPSG